MREYYSHKGTVNSDPSQPLDRYDLHWSLLSVLCEGWNDHYRADIKEKILNAIKHQDVNALISHVVEVDSYSQKYESEKTPLSVVRQDRCVASFLKKFPFKDSPFDTRKAALASLHQAEESCFKTNEKIRLNRTKFRDEPVIRRARSLIWNVLGDLTNDKLDKIAGSAVHGPGATLTHKGNRTTPYYKFSPSGMSVTSRAAPYALALLRSQELWWHSIVTYSDYSMALPPPGWSRAKQSKVIFDSLVSYQEVDKVTFVPKDARKDRPIAIGASLNMMLQLGVKSYIEESLKKVGVDLTDQTKNQEMAFAGSRFCVVSGDVNPNQYSTIDLSSASDTISLELVFELLPRDWFALLADLRHDGGRLENDFIHYEKFSAMGNGYTFPLESLIFWAVAKAAAEEEAGRDLGTKDISIFGDDIICRYAHANAVIESLELCGFSVNTEKSFVKGPFKESCGKDYYKGFDVRPFYLKREIKTYGDIYFAANSIAEISLSWENPPYLLKVFNAIMAFIPKAKRRYQDLEGSYENALCVPYSFMVYKGLTPWLRRDERDNLYRRRLFAHSPGRGMQEWQSPIVIESIPIAKTYKGSEQRRYLTSLFYAGRKTQHEWRSYLDLITSSTSNITRRKSVKYVTRVRPSPSWDGRYTPEQLQKHVSYSLD